MDKMSLLSILVGVTLILSLINVYSTFSLGQQFNAITRQIALGDTIADGGGDIKEAQPLGGNLGNTPPQPQIVKASPDDDAVMGSADAPVTIVEFSDYECPFCTRFVTQTLPALKEKYIDTGKAKLIYRDFPLGFHQFAQKAAEAAECADEEGKYWEMHDKLFENQDALDSASLKQYAVDIGLDASKFNECLDSGKNASEVKKDLADGGNYGVSGTPTFFINGTKIVGAQPLSVFEQAIDAALAKKGS